jgi:hypothetical protein
MLPETQPFRTLLKILDGFFLKILTQLYHSLQEARCSGGEKKETSVDWQETPRTFTAVVLRTINSGRHICVTAYYEFLFCFTVPYWWQKHALEAQFPIQHPTVWQQ